MIFLYCKLGTRLSHYNKLPRKNIDIGRYHLSTVENILILLKVANGEKGAREPTTYGKHAYAASRVC